MAILVTGTQRIGVYLGSTPFACNGSAFAVGTTRIATLNASGNPIAWRNGSSFNNLPGNNKDELPPYSAFIVNPTALITIDDNLFSFGTPLAISQTLSVAVTSPTNNASIDVNTQQTLTATASNSSGTVASVQFRVNGVNVGVPLSTAPYTTTWTPTTAGSYVLTAVATDSNGLSRISPSVVIGVSEAAIESNANLIGINLPAVADYQAPFFRDAARQSRAYLNTTDSELPSSSLNGNGYPTIADFNIYIWADGFRRHGTYAITITHPNTYTGGGTLTSLGGTLSNINYNNVTKITTATWVHTEEGSSTGALRFRGFTGGITHLKIMRPSSAGSSTPYDEAKVFMDSMIDAIGKFDGTRLLDTTGVNTSTIQTWNERTLPTDYSQARAGQTAFSIANNLIEAFGFAGRGMAWEYVCTLASEVKARYPHFKAIWVNIPILADDDYITQFFTLMRDELDPSILLKVEYGNENWNFAPGFTQSGYNRDLAIAEVNAGNSPLNYDGSTNQYEWAWRRTAKRTIEIYDIAVQVYDSSVDTRVQIQLQWQQANAQATASTMLSFADKALNATSKIAKFGLGGSWYYNPNSNDPNLNADNIWMSGTMNIETWATNWLQVDVHFVAAYSPPTGNLPWHSYEGGTSFDKVFAGNGLTQSQADVNNATMKAANYDSRMTQNMIDHVDIRSKHGGSWAYAYKLGGAHDAQYEWAFLYNHDDYDTPKMDAIATLRGRNRAALDYGRLAPFTINGGLWDANDKGYGSKVDSQYQMMNNETVFYTFRLTTPGSYQFSIRASNGTYSLSLGSHLFGSVTIANDNFTTPFSFNCPNPGLYSFKIRNTSGGNRDIKQVKITAG